ncbi:universal stress protein [Nesterenkonia halophila]|uniref:universal stress protein n=1 Tax=Nesterenkonia halophila TaxID=302044 RepID=UPI0012921573|nr:universal stress protein [Nesterenkonia halophila]
MSRETPPARSAIAYDAAQRPLGVVVGFDGSENSRRALDHAAETARRRESPLTVVTAYHSSPPIYTTLAAVPEEPEAEVRRREVDAVLEAARKLLADHPGRVDYRAERGDSTGVLAELSGSAELVVVGARGRGGFLELVLGSVASALPSHAKAPTVIVPSDEAAAAHAADAAGPVVVGVDGSSESRVAALQAAHAAAERGAELQLVMAAPSRDGLAQWYPNLVEEQALAAQRKELETSLEAEASWLAHHVPEVTIRSSVEIGSSIPLLTDHSREAQLTVVGTRGRGAVAGTLLGSTSRGVLHHAHSPVMVVPALDDDRVSG